MKEEALKRALLMKREKDILTPEGAVSTGCTLLNLACTDRPDVGFLKGHYYYLVGDSASGKTWLTLSCFAEASLNPAFKDYRFVFDDVENGALMDIEHYFGAIIQGMDEAMIMAVIEGRMPDVHGLGWKLQGMVWAGNIGLTLLWVAAALTLLTGMDYFRKALPLLGEDR